MTETHRLGGKIHLRRRDFTDLIYATRAARRTFNRQLVEATGGVAQAGPLRGFKLPGNVVWGADTGNQLFGLYEQQLFDVLCGSPGAIFLDLGAANGYWACGLVKAGFVTRSYAFEISEEAQQAIKDCAAENGISDRVHVYGEANEVSLAELELPTDAPILALIDIEGAEFDVVTPGFLARLKNATVVIELHPWTQANKAQAMENLIAITRATHSHEIINDAKRDASALLDHVTMHDVIRYAVINEGRGRPQEWLILKPLGAN